MKLLFFGAAVTLSLSCYGQMHHNVRERGNDRREQAQNRWEARDDRQDLRTLHGLLRRLDAARATGDLSAAALVQRELLDTVAREISEGHWEVAKDTREVQRDRAELGGDRRELRGDYARGQPHRAAEDRRDLRDDRRDLRDDLRDRRHEVRSLERAKLIHQELAALNGHTDPASLHRTRALLVELIGWGRWELRENREERREDRRELREDRRETREDARQR